MRPMCSAVQRVRDAPDRSMRMTSQQNVVLMLRMRGYIPPFSNISSCPGFQLGKGKGHAHNRPQGPKAVPGRLRPRIFLTFGTTRVVGRQPHAPAAFTPRGIPWYSFLEDESTPGHMVPSVATENIPSVTSPGIDPETVRLVAQCLNHYATPGPWLSIRLRENLTTNF
jgi:hypothetical protein